ncbi:MAG: hypothetical protein ABI443_09570 [Chthoniobacterales bacterium]
MTINFDRHFPRFESDRQQVPIWCLTPHEGRCTHRFFDTSPISPSGRYVALLRFPFEDHLSAPGDVAHVILIDLETGDETVVAETRGWEFQLGANLNWGGGDHELFFNDVDTSTWTPFAWKLDPLTGQRLRLEGTVYHASPNGRLLISSNLVTTRKTQCGYGVCLPEAMLPPLRVGPLEDDGFWITDTRTGKSRLLISTKTIFDRLSAELSTPNVDPDRSEIAGFHSKFNPQGDALMLSLRWFSAAEEAGWDMFKKDFNAVQYAWVTLRIDPVTGEADLSTLRCATGSKLWQKHGHHGTWFPDGRRISQNLAINGNADGLRFVQVNADGSGLGIIPGTETLPGSGHPTMHPDDRHILTDSYPREPVAYGDGTVPLRWIDLRTGEETHLARVNALNPAEVIHSSLRCDPHPAWDRTFRYVVFNGMDKDVRRVYIADLTSMIDH